jgi:hypothetical protein
MNGVGTVIDQEAFFTSPLQDLLTLRDIAARSNVPLARVQRIVERYAIAPARRRGVVRLWTTAQAEQIAALLQRE